MLVVLTGRRPLSIVDGDSVHILAWVEACLSSGTPDRLKELLMSMDAPDDAVLRLAQLALSCTVQRTASRPTTAEISNELQGVRNEVVGRVELSAAVKVDALVKEMRGASPMDAHLNEINELLHGDSFDDP
ncbi:unnamed protein product [Closterium sp. Naga37s-1]|nr:unnamed protein product [Closterium sp. Naga37s-1]